MPEWIAEPLRKEHEHDAFSRGHASLDDFLKSTPSSTPGANSEQPT
jgi:hypothetical protein